MNDRISDVRRAALCSNGHRKHETPLAQDHPGDVTPAVREYWRFVAAKLLGFGRIGVIERIHTGDETFVFVPRSNLLLQCPVLQRGIRRALVRSPNRASTASRALESALMAKTCGLRIRNCRRATNHAVVGGVTPVVSAAPFGVGGRAFGPPALASNTC